MSIPPLPPNHLQPKSLQAISIPPPVLKILSDRDEIQSASLPPIVPAVAESLVNPPPLAGTDAEQNSQKKVAMHQTVKVNNKVIDTSKKARQWIWAPFSSSARSDGLLLHHWVRAGVEYSDYPFARFDVHLDKMNYKADVDETEVGNNDVESVWGKPSGDIVHNIIKDGPTENVKSNTISDVTITNVKQSSRICIYNQYLQDPMWTQSETDALLNLCHIHELRWPIIMDRWITQFGRLSGKKVEDLQYRYYTIGMILNRRKVEKVAKVEAENLAKIVAQNATGSGSGGAALGESVKNNITASSPLQTMDVQSKEKLRAEHALAVSMVNSSSTAIFKIVGDVKASIQPIIPSINTGTVNQVVFNLQTERQRRRLIETLWLRSKEEEVEETELLQELKLVETQIRRLKKSGGHILAAAASSSTMASTNVNNSLPLGGTSSIIGTTPVSSRGTSPVPPSSFGVMAVGADATDSSYSLLHTQFMSTTPTPTPGTPYLQSGRLAQPATGGHLGINKTALKRMEQVLKELYIMERPIPTKRVCDLYDHVRKGVLMLLTLQKVMLKKESEVVSRRVKLEKVAGSAVAREVANTNATAATNTVVTAMKNSSGALITKVKGGSAGIGGLTSTPKYSVGVPKKFGGGKGKGSKKKSGDGSKSGTKRKSSSKKTAVVVPSATNVNNIASTSGGSSATTSVAIAPTMATVANLPTGSRESLLVGSTSVIMSTSAKNVNKVGDVSDPTIKSNKKRARKT